MDEQQRPLRIIGCGGHARVIADIAFASGERSVGFLDDDPARAPSHLSVEGPVLQRVRDLASTHRFIVGVGDAKIRRMFAHAVLEAGGRLATLVHPKAVVAHDVTIGVGTVVMAGAIINTGTKIGRFAVINTAATIDHDNLIEDNVQIAPGAHLAGAVTCRANAFVAIGATVIPGLEIGEGSFVAAGSVVTHPVKPKTLVAGCPAVFKKHL